MKENKHKIQGQKVLIILDFFMGPQVTFLCEILVTLWADEQFLTSVYLFKRL